MAFGRAPPKPDLKKALTGPCPAREGTFMRCASLSFPRWTCCVGRTSA